MVMKMGAHPFRNLGKDRQNPTIRIGNGKGLRMTWEALLDRETGNRQYMYLAALSDIIRHLTRKCSWSSISEQPTQGSNNEDPA